MILEIGNLKAENTAKNELEDNNLIQDSFFTKKGKKTFKTNKTNNNIHSIFLLFIKL